MSREKAKVFYLELYKKRKLAAKKAAKENVENKQDKLIQKQKKAHKTVVPSQASETHSYA